MVKKNESTNHRVEYICESHLIRTCIQNILKFSKLNIKKNFFQKFGKDLNGHITNEKICHISK